MATASNGAPSPAAPQSFWDYREYFKGCVRRFHRVGAGEGSEGYEARSPATPLNEKLVHLIWANQMFQPEGLRLVDGRALRVLDPGRWNGSAGPDFQAAQVMIGEEIFSGDVEIHIEASQWKAHRHDRDIDYNGVVLHVVFQNDDGLEADVLHNARRLPRFELEPYLFPDLDTIRRSLSPDDFEYERPSTVGRCYDVMASTDSALLVDFLDRAGDERLKAKIARLEDQAGQAQAEQVFYQALMTSLGSGAGKTLYFLLAKRAPVAELLDEVKDLQGAERREAIESILLWVANLNPTEEELAAAPEESRIYAAHLAELWARFEPFWADRIIPPTRRWYRGIRPVNFPTRRLAAVAGLLARGLARDEAREKKSGSGASRSSAAPHATPHLLHDLAERVRASAPSLKTAQARRRAVHPLIRDLTQWFLIDAPGNFWETHYSFKAKPAGRPMVLIGESTARSLVFNAVLPALGLYARLNQDETLSEAVQRLYAIFPPLQKNHVTEFMSRRLFGEDSPAADLLNTERRRQGLFQVFYGCCRSEPSHCDACYYLEGLGKSWEELQAKARG